MRAALAAGLIWLALVAPARAELPDYVLDKDYQSCMGSEPNDRERAAYCQCVRNGMKNWDLTTYMEVATQAAAGSKTPARLEELARQCIAQTMH